MNMNINNGMIVCRAKIVLPQLVEEDGKKLGCHNLFPSVSTRELCCTCEGMTMNV